MDRITDREVLVSIARSAAESKLYRDVVDAMTKVAKMGTELTEFERNLLLNGFKSKISHRIPYLRSLSSTVNLGESNEVDVEALREYLIRPQTELGDMVTKMTSFIDEYFLRSCISAETYVLCQKTKGDLYRYLAVISTSDDDLEKFSGFSYGAYQSALNEAKLHLAASNPVRLACSLNHAVFHFEILGSAPSARSFAERAIEEAEVDESSDPCIQKLLQLLKDNLHLWSNNASEDQISFLLNHGSHDDAFLLNHGSRDYSS